MNVRENIIATAVYHGGDWLKILDALTRKEFLPPEDVIRINRELKCGVVTLLDREYPEYLRHITKPPIVLFYEGDLSLIKEPFDCLAVVGTRHPTTRGERITREIVKETCKRYITVSGLASGVDRIAHLTTIENGGKTVAVLGSGIDCCYPSENQDIFNIIKKDHLLISEYPPGCPPRNDNFPTRNRLIAMFSRGILITESAVRSGTSITASYGLEYGRNIMCVPSENIEYSGCNKWIKTGAYLVENADDVIFLMK